jgi:hypothetical protein
MFTLEYCKMMLTDRETEENSKAAVYCGPKKKKILDNFNEIIEVS